MKIKLTFLIVGIILIATIVVAQVSISNSAKDKIEQELKQIYTEAIVTVAETKDTIFGWKEEKGNIIIDPKQVVDVPEELIKRIEFEETKTEQAKELYVVTLN